MIVTDLSNSFNPYPKSEKKQNRSGQIKQKSSKLAKKERNRFSILQSEKKCFICGCKDNLDKHEAFGGCNRQKSMEWGLVYYLCRRCHREVEDDESMKKKLKMFAQGKFNAKYGADKFFKEFGRNF